MSPCSSSILRDDRGSINTIFAITLPVLMGFGGLMVDLGKVYLDRRDLQAATDAATMAAMTDPPKAHDLATRTFAANGYAGVAFEIRHGVYTPDPKIDPSKRFVETDRGANALRIDAHVPTRAWLAGAFWPEGMRVAVRSQAQADPVVSLAIGSRLASLGDGLVADVAKSVLGADIGLSVLDYKGLLNADLKLGPLLSAVASLTGGTLNTVGDVLDREIRVSVLLEALGKGIASTAGAPGFGSTVAQKASRNLAKATATVRLGDIVHVDDGLRGISVSYPSSALSTEVSALGILQATVARAGIGNIVEAGLSIPGVAKVGTQILLGEEMQKSAPLGVGALPNVQTAQVRLRASVETTGIVSALGTGIDLPVELVVAGGTAKVTSVSCADGKVNVEVVPGIAKAEINVWSKPLAKASIQGVKSYVDIVKALHIVRLSAYSIVRISDATPVRVTFSQPEIRAGTIKTVKSKGIVSGLVSSLLKETDIKVLGLSTGILTSSVAGILGTLAASVDDVLNGVLKTVGIGLGEVDVRIDDLVCGVPRIVG